MSETYKVYASQEWVQEQLKSVQTEVDTTLTVPDKAADAKAVGERLKPTRLQDFKTLGPQTTLDENMQDPFYIIVDYLDWPEEDRAAFLLEGKRYPLIIGGKTYLTYTKNGGENVGLYLGNPALSYDNNLKALGDSGEDFVIYRYPEPADASSPYIFVSYKEALGGTSIQFFYPVSDQVIDELGIIEDDLAAVSKSLVPTNLQNGKAEGSLRTIYSTEETEEYTLGQYAMSTGLNTKAPGKYGHAEGWKSEANASESHAEGEWSKANGAHSHAEGSYTQTYGQNSHAEGSHTITYGIASHAEGESQRHSHGNDFQLSGEGGSLEYTYTQSVDYNMLEIPVDTIIRYIPTNIYARIVHVDKAARKLTLDKTLSEQAIVNALASDLEFFYGGIAIGRTAHVEGTGNFAKGQYSHAENNGTFALGIGSHSEGDATEARGEYSHAEGNRGIALGKYSHIQNGIKVRIGLFLTGSKMSNVYTCNGQNAELVAGRYLTCQGIIAKILKVEESDETTIITLDRTLSPNVDLDNVTAFIVEHLAGGEASTVIGIENIANGEGSFSGGKDNIINGNCSFGWGEGLYSKLGNNFYIGKYNKDSDTMRYVEEATDTNYAFTYLDTEKILVTKIQPVLASDNLTYVCSNVEQKKATELTVDDYIILDLTRYCKPVNANYITSWGEVIGNGTLYYLIWNDSTDCGTNAFAIGNGTYENQRSNAHTVDWDGNAWYSGDVYVGSTSGTNKDAGSKKLATEEFVLQNSSGNIVVSSTTPSNPAVGTIWFQV